MAEYIEREAVLKLFDKVGCYLNPKCLERQKEDIRKIPTADVVEVKHGEWIENDYRAFDGFETAVYPNEALKCSNCNHNFKKELLWCKNYCPECGAKMDGERRCRQ